MQLLEVSGTVRQIYIYICVIRQVKVKDVIIETYKHIHFKFINRVEKVLWMEENKFKDYTLFPFLARLCRDSAHNAIVLYSAIK